MDGSSRKDLVTCLPVVAIAQQVSLIGLWIIRGTLGLLVSQRVKQSGRKLYKLGVLIYAT